MRNSICKSIYYDFKINIGILLTIIFLFFIYDIFLYKMFLFFTQDEFIFIEENHKFAIYQKILLYPLYSLTFLVIFFKCNKNKKYRHIIDFYFKNIIIYFAISFVIMFLLYFGHYIIYFLKTFIGALVFNVDKKYIVEEVFKNIYFVYFAMLIITYYSTIISCFGSNFQNPDESLLKNFNIKKSVIYINGVIILYLTIILYVIIECIVNNIDYWNFRSFNIDTLLFLNFGYSVGFFSIFYYISVLYFYCDDHISETAKNLIKYGPIHVSRDFIEENEDDEEDEEYEIY